MVLRAVRISALAAAAVAVSVTVCGAQDRKWEIEVHAGGMMMGSPTDATTAMPPAGEAFTTLNGRPSRAVSSFYFGDGTVLFNQWAAAVTAAFNVPTTERITPLDSVLTGSAARFSNTGSLGVRVGRRLSRRVTAEVNVDFARSRLELSQSALGDIEASRATFASAWNQQFGVPPAASPWVNPVVSSTSEFDEGTGSRIVATGALNLRLRRGGTVVPYVTGGLGGVFNRGRAPSVTLNGNYSMTRVGQGGQVPVGTVLSYNDADAVTMRFVRPDRVLVGVVGGGLTYDLARGHGLRVDLRLHIGPNAVDTMVSATPSVRMGSPGAMAAFASNTTPTVVVSNTGSGATLSGPAISSFRTREGSSWQIDTALTAGYFWRF